MTAHELIADIFSRVQDGRPGHQRGISRAQLDFLRKLIDEDEDGGAVQATGAGKTIWMPSGRNKYEIKEDLTGNRHVLTKLSNLAATGCGRLF
jgi:hypothetical protein